MFQMGLAIGLSELALCFVLGIAVTYSAYRYTLSAFDEFDGLEQLHEKNVAVGIVFAASIIGSAMIVNASIFPAMSTLKTALQGGTQAMGLPMAIGWIAIFSVVSIGAALFMLRVSMRLAILLTHGLDEVAEIRKNNTAAALLLGSIIVANSLFLSRGVESLLLAMVPYPTSGAIQIMGA